LCRLPPEYLTRHICAGLLSRQQLLTVGYHENFYRDLKRQEN